MVSRAEERRRRKELEKQKGEKTVLSLLSSFSGIPWSGKNERGLRAEEKAFKASQYWVKKKVIRKVRKTEGLGVEDMNKIDLVLTLITGQEVAVQIKNYINQKEAIECQEAGVLLFHIYELEGMEIAIKRMLGLIWSCYLAEFNHSEMRQLIIGLKKPTPPKEKLLARLRKVFH